MTSITSSAERRYPGWVPLMTPAVKKGSSEIDEVLLTVRFLAVSAAALGVFALLALVFTTEIASVAIVIPLVVSFIDNEIAQREANIKAVNEYLTKPFPSKIATSRIRSNWMAAELLAECGREHLNKTDETGNRLLDTDDRIFKKDDVFSFDRFKLFVRNGADLKLEKDGVSYFQKIVEDENPERLEWVLRTKKVKPEDFTEAKTVGFWTNLGSIKAAELLKQYKFDVNAKDPAGYTPLMLVAIDASLTMRRFSRSKLGYEAHIATLLKCEADISLTVHINRTEMTALDLFCTNSSENPGVRRILEEAAERVMC